MKTDLFQFCGHCWVFQICWHIECSTFTASSFRIWDSSTGIPSPPLDLFVVMLPKVNLTSHSRVSGSSQWSHHHDYLDREDLFCTVLLCLPKNHHEKLICSVAELSKHLLISNGNFILKTEPLTLGIFVPSVKISEISIYWSSLPKPNHPNLIPDVLLMFFKNVLEN